MLIDTPVLYFNLEEYLVTVLSETHLPFSLRGTIFDRADTKTLFSNTLQVKMFLSARLISIQRKNAKQILKHLKLSTRNDMNTRCNIALYCKALTLTDSYWVKREVSTSTWSDVNLYTNRLDEALIDVSLNGVSYTPTTTVLSPELTTKGLFKKAWLRKADGLYLYKSDDLEDKTNTKAEAIASQLLDAFGLSHCPYNLETHNGELMVICPCLATDELSMVDASDIKLYCNANGINFRDLCKRIGGVDYHNMFVVDYLISNTDRHDGNWAFYMNNDTGKLVSMVPLYDHNLSLIADITGASKNDNLLSNFREFKTLKEGAIHHLPYSSIKAGDLSSTDYMGYPSLQGHIEKRLSTLNLI